MEIAAPGRMRPATKLRGKPHNGARPTISKRSGKPLKNSPKKPSTSPAVNHSGRPTGKVNLAFSPSPFASMVLSDLSRFILRCTSHYQKRLPFKDSPRRKAHPGICGSEENRSGTDVILHHVSCPATPHRPCGRAHCTAQGQFAADPDACPRLWHRLHGPGEHQLCLLTDE